MKTLSKLFIVILLIGNISSCTRDDKEIGEDELDFEREEEYRPGDFSEKELELNRQ